MVLRQIRIIDTTFCALFVLAESARHLSAATFFLDGLWMKKES